jgi:hypothetical protein
MKPRLLEYVLSGTTTHEIGERLRLAAYHIRLNGGAPEEVFDAAKDRLSASALAYYHKLSRSDEARDLDERLTETPRLTWIAGDPITESARWLRLSRLERSHALGYLSYHRVGNGKYVSSQGPDIDVWAIAAHNAWTGAGGYVVLSCDSYPCVDLYTSPDACLHSAVENRVSVHTIIVVDNPLDWLAIAKMNGHTLYVGLLGHDAVLRTMRDMYPLAEVVYAGPRTRAKDIQAQVGYCRSVELAPYSMLCDGQSPEAIVDAILTNATDTGERMPPTSIPLIDERVIPLFDLVVSQARAHNEANGNRLVAKEEKMYLDGKACTINSFLRWLDNIKFVTSRQKPVTDAIGNVLYTDDIRVIFTPSADITLRMYSDPSWLDAGRTS